MVDMSQTSSILCNMAVGLVHGLVLHIHVGLTTLHLKNVLWLNGGYEPN